MFSFLSHVWKRLWLRGQFKENNEHLKIKGQKNKIVLCVDDDVDFCLYLQKLSKRYPIQLELAYTMREAKLKIEKYEFAAFIIDGHLPDGPGFELVEWMRQHHIDKPISFISRIYQDAATFRLLKEKFNVVYVLEKPLTPAKVDQLFLHMQIVEDGSLISDDGLEAVLSDLKRDYQKSIFDKIEGVEKLILQVQRQPSLASLSELKTAIHKLAGSAGSYGFTTVSAICKDLEVNLDQQLTKIKTDTFNAGWLTVLDDFFSQLKLNFQTRSFLEAAGEKLSLIEFPFIYAVNKDSHFLQLLESHKPEHITLMTETDVEQALLQLKTSRICPRVLLLSEETASLVTNKNLVTALCSQKTSSCPKTIFLFVRSRYFPDALIQGIDYLFHHDLPIQDLWKSCLEVGTLSKTGNVLILDQDTDAARYATYVLQNAGITSYTIHDEKDVAEALSIYRPKLLVVDTYFSKQGLNFLTELKQHPLCEGIACIVLTTSSSADILETLDKVYAVDDIITKPIDGQLLQKHVLSLLEDKKQLKKTKKMYSKEEFEELIAFELTSNTPISLLAFVFIEITTVYSSLGKQKEEAFLSLLEHFLAVYLNRYEAIGLIRSRVYGLFYKGYDLHFIHAIIEQALNALQEELQLQGESPITCNCGIAFIPPEKISVEQVVRKVERALQLARQQGEKNIKLASLEEDQARFKDKTAYLIGNHLINNRLKHFFNTHHFKVKELENVEAIWQMLENEKTWPICFVIPFDLNMEALAFSKQLKERYDIQCSVVISPFSTLELFLYQSGDYLQQPFNLIIEI